MLSANVLFVIDATSTPVRKTPVELPEIVLPLIVKRPGLNPRNHTPMVLSLTMTSRSTSEPTADEAPPFITIALPTPELVSPTNATFRKLIVFGLPSILTR